LFCTNAVARAGRGGKETPESTTGASERVIGIASGKEIENDAVRFSLTH
jgi:hypothetical protein